MKKVLLGLSWWVDSAVAAHLLLKQGYEVIAWFMKNYADEDNPNCHTKKDRDEAIKVAKHLWIKDFRIFDFREEYDKKIIQYIYDTYKAWLTPNPDILCNSEIKFKLFLEKAIKLWCNYVATGHYARITSKDKKYHLLKGVDTNKDQSYFLSMLNQFQLSKSLFPLGELTKPQVREIAQKIGLPNANRKDSQWLCFIGKVDMKTFLAETLPIKKWHILDEQGKILGEHDGVWFYTIWQRQWLGLSGGPRYVLERNIKNNTLIVWLKDAWSLFHHGLVSTQRHRISEKPLSLPLQAKAKIRYRQKDQDCTITQISQTQYHVKFTQAQRAISPGQTIVIYQGDEVIASGIIEKKD